MFIFIRKLICFIWLARGRLRRMHNMNINNKDGNPQRYCFSHVIYFRNAHQPTTPCKTTYPVQQTKHYRFLHYIFLMYVFADDDSSPFFRFLILFFSFFHRLYTHTHTARTRTHTYTQILCSVHCAPRISHKLFQIQVYRSFSFVGCVPYFQDSLNFLSLPRLYYGIVWCASNAFIRNEIICVMATFSGAFFVFFLLLSFIFYFFATCNLHWCLTQHNLDSLRE